MAASYYLTREGRHPRAAGSSSDLWRNGVCVIKIIGAAAFAIIPLAPHPLAAIAALQSGWSDQVRFDEDLEEVTEFDLRLG